MEKNGVRKGAWTKEEDTLLKNCIEKYGEGNWHKVPLRAGLNRCRKSCRLRWLNYLRPNIKRGYFAKDEVDLILRLHNLLGNRWSLIAGRLPGRTANDVKNFWNTHIAKTTTAGGGRGKSMQKAITQKNIIKPRPRTFSKLDDVPVWSNEVTEKKDKNRNKMQPSSSASLSQQETNSVENPTNNQPFSVSVEMVDECIQWWSNLLEITGNGDGTPFFLSEGDNMPPTVSPGLSGSRNNLAN